MNTAIETHIDNFPLHVVIKKDVGYVLMRPVREKIQSTGLTGAEDMALDFERLTLMEDGGLTTGHEAANREQFRAYVQMLLDANKNSDSFYAWEVKLTDMLATVDDFFDMIEESDFEEMHDLRAI